jgi:glucose/arabinose dehydrogenase
MRIGELAALVGVSTRTVRYYHHLVITADDLRIRYGAYFDLRVPHDKIASVRLTRNYNETGIVAVKDGLLTVAVGSRTNVTIELTEPLTVVRPLGRRAEVTRIRFFADEPGLARSPVAPY